MNTNEYTATCKLSKIGSIQEASEITYSATYETEKSSIIKVIKSNSDSTARFRCQASFYDCIGLITLFTENCVYPVHCKDVADDLGYKMHAITR